MGEGNLCRLCAVPKECFVGIYDDEGYKLNLESKITKCLQIELYPKDPLPKSVCLDCCAKLNQCSDFFEASSAAQVTLHMIFPDTKKEETEEETEEENQQHPEPTVEPEPEPQRRYEPENESSISVEEEACKAEPKTQEFVESVLSEKQGNKEENGVNDALPPLASKRKRRVPVRFTTLLEEVNTKENTERPRRRTRRGRVKIVADSADLKLEDELAEPKEEETEMDVIDDFVLPSLGPPDVDQHQEKQQDTQEINTVVKKKQRGNWDMYPWICSDCSQEHVFADPLSASSATTDRQKHVPHKKQELPTLEALRSHHQVEHNQLPRYMCAQCSKVYDKYYGFVSHVRRHRNHRKFICEECGKCFSNKKVLESHRATHSDVRPYVCSECGKSFRQQSALYVHNRSHQPDEVKNRYPCDECDKRFSTKPNLVTHKRIHTGIRNFTCDQCGKSFIQKGNLDSHLLTHSSDKPFSCPICSKGFKTPLQLRKHQSVHTGAKPHQCDVCGRQFRERGTLREHHRIHTGAMPFTCEFCGKSFRFKGILTTHRRQHTGERPYSCIECQHHFTNWPNYNKHMKRRHGINTSHQPDPNKLAVAAAAAAAAEMVAVAGVSVDGIQQLPSMLTVSNMNTHSSNMYNSQAQNTTHLSAIVDQQQQQQPQHHPQQQPQHQPQPPQQQQQRGGITMQFYNPAPIYTTGTLPPGTMLGFYNLPQLQQTVDITALDMLHTVQQR